MTQHKTPQEQTDSDNILSAASDLLDDFVDGVGNAFNDAGTVISVGADIALTVGVAAINVISAIVDCAADN